MSEAQVLPAESLGASEAESSYFRAIVENLHDAVYVRDKDCAIRYMNPAAERLTGWTVEDSAFHPCRRIFGDPDARRHLDCQINQAPVNRRPTRHMESTVTRRDGKAVPVEVSITPTSDDRAGAMIVLRDISRMRRLDKAHLNLLRELEIRSREAKRDAIRISDFAELSNGWFWETDADHRFIRMTGETFYAHEQYIGYRRQDLVDIGADQARWAPFFNWLDKRQPFANFVYPATGPVGERRWVSISGKPIYDEHDRFLGYRGIGRNVGKDDADL